MTDRYLKPSLFFVFTVILATNIIGAVLSLFSFPQTLYIAGFRFHIFTIVLFASVAIFKYYPPVKLDFLTFKASLLWQFLVYFLLLVVPVILLFIFKFVKFTDPDFLYELGASSLIDLPLYLIWLVPLFYSLFTWYSSLLNLPWGRIWIFLLGFIPFLFNVFNFSNFVFNASVLPVLVIYGIILSISALSRNFYLFYFWAYIPVWIYVIAFGINNTELLQVLLAKTYDEWEGLFSVKGVMSEFRFFIFSAFCLLLLLIGFFINRAYWRRSNSDPASLQKN